MPISPSTMFMNLKGLAIRYRASADPQKLEVAVQMKRKSVDSLARGVMSDLVEAMTLGAGAGEEFSPAHSTAKLIKAGRVRASLGRSRSRASRPTFSASWSTRWPTAAGPTCTSTA